MAERIELNDSPMNMIVKMGDGNIGAITALTELFAKGSEIDPDSFQGGFSTILGLDSLGIYGTDIYVLWSDICNRNTAGLIAIIRAHQLGLISSSLVKDIASRQDRSGKSMIDMNTVYDSVKNELPNFDPTNVFVK